MDLTELSDVERKLQNNAGDRAVGSIALGEDEQLVFARLFRSEE